MAELGDALERGGAAKDVTIDMLDYDFLDKCSDPDLIRAIIRKLKSGEEGHFPDLLKHAETRLLAELPPTERSKILRMKAEPQSDEIYEAINDLHSWEDEIANVSSTIAAPAGQQQPAPRWTSCTIAEIDDRTTKEVPFSSRASVGECGDGTSKLSTGLSREHSKTKKLSAYDFRAWEHYNAEEEIERLEEEEREEELRKAEATLSAKAKAERDRLRRAKKREDQLREAGKARFKETLSPLEKRRAADRERVKGNECFKVKEYEEAFRCYTWSLALDDTNPRVYNNRAATAHQLKRFGQAEDDCARAIYLDPTYKKAWMRRGMVRHSRGKYAGAVADFTEALILDPNDKHAKKLKEHSAAKVCEVEGTVSGDTKGGGDKKRGRILIEEVDTLEEEDGKYSEMVRIPITTAAAAPPTLGSKKTLIADGWMDIQ